MTEFEKAVKFRLDEAESNRELKKAAQDFMRESISSQYSYNWFWLGRPIIQYPQDICAMQELVWEIKPDVIVETGIAHGGSLILSASMLAMIDLCEAAETGELVDPRQPKRKVIGVDIDIRQHNRTAIKAHPLSNRIKMIEGSSVDHSIVAQVEEAIGAAQKVMVCLDSNHTHDHVLQELEHYAPLVSIDSYCVVFDTVIENLPQEMYPDRPWGPGDNAMTAVDTYLRDNPNFVIDNKMDAKLQISVAPRGYIKRVR